MASSNTTPNKFMNEQVTVRMPNDLLSRVDRLAENEYQTRGAWMRAAIAEKVRKEERKRDEEFREVNNL